jgi:transglutaminase-like putative cysteine protease
MRVRISIPTLVILLLSVFVDAGRTADLRGELKGVLVWFYTLEVVDGKERGNVLYFKQTAGVSHSRHQIHEILPLSPQSSISRDETDNWLLDLSPDRLVVTKDRPLFLGQVLNITKGGNLPKRLTPRHNVLLNTIKFDVTLDRYLTDRKDLLINDPAISKVRDTLIASNPRILDYIIAVDQFVHDRLDYGVCKRPNSAVDILTFSNGRCGEYAKLKQSLLRSAGIPTRDVYATRTAPYGPGIDGGDDSHVWLQAYIPRAEWIAVPSTRKLKAPFLAFQGGYHPEGYYLRALDLYRHEVEIQKKGYTYNALKRSGGVRGNGMLLRINQREFQSVQTVASRILEYDNVPDVGILEEIESLPVTARPLLYWFAISLPDDTINQMAAKEFMRYMKLRRDLKLESFLAVSPVLVSQRIERAVASAK